VVSLYSNTGSWVKTYRPGTAVVSTMPVTFNASSRQQVLRSGPPNPARGLVDDDDYSPGFGVWSGTSFAAPAFAADVAQQLVTPTGEHRERGRVGGIGDAVARALNDTRDNRAFDEAGEQ